MDHILEQFSKDDSELLLQNQIRQILECILRKLTDIHLIPKHFDKEDSAKNDFETLNKKVDYLTKTCHFKHTADGGFEYSTRQFKDKILKKKIPDFDTPIVPYALCSAETKKTIAYLAEITNLYSHALDITKDKVLGENEQHVYCPPYVCKSIYAAFISVIIWYNDFMKKHEESGSVFNMLDQIKEPNVIPFAQLEWDDEWCVYHCGNYMVPTEDVERNKYKKNEYHYIICSEPMNADGKYKRKAKLLYPQNS